MFGPILDGFPRWLLRASWSILHHNPFPSVYSVVNEFLVEETWLESQIEKGNIVKEILSTPNQYVYAVHSNKGKSRGRNCYDECSFCKQKGHWKAQCPKLLNKWQPPQWKSPN